MTDKKLPFYRKEVECPVCGGVTENFVFKTKVVIPREVEPDNYVITYQWIDKGYKKYPPAFYVLWVCKSCGYADFPEYFQVFNKSHTYEFTILKKAILKDKKDKKSLIPEIIKCIDLDGDEISFETSMNIHLLALYCNVKLYPDNDNFEKIGRLYLRNAWLFRDFKRLGLKDKEYNGYKTYWEYIKSLRNFWTEIPVDEESNISKAAYFFSSIIMQDFSYEKAVKNIKFICLSAELFLRLNDFKSAYKIIHGVVKLGFDMRREINETLQNKRKNSELTRQEERILFSRSDRISRELSGIHDKYREVKDKWINFYMPQIEEIIKENQWSTPQVLITKLEEANIPSEVIYILKSTDSRFRVEDEEKPHFWEFWK